MKFRTLPSPSNPTKFPVTNKHRQQLPSILFRRFLVIIALDSTGSDKHGSKRKQSVLIAILELTNKRDFRSFATSRLMFHTGCGRLQPEQFSTVCRHDMIEQMRLLRCALKELLPTDQFCPVMHHSSTAYFLSASCFVCISNHYDVNNFLSLICTGTQSTSAAMGLDRT
jgi:hypothetical protein